MSAAEGDGIVYSNSWLRRHADRAGTGIAARSAASPPGPSLSEEEQLKRKTGKLARDAKAQKVVYCVEQNVLRLASEYGVGHLAFLTLTFAEQVTDVREASRRFNSLNSGMLSKRGYGPWVRIVERQASGRIHFHLIIVVPMDIREGFDPVTGKGSGAGWVWLCRQRKLLREKMPRYSFGRVELLPLKKETIAGARYLSKYLTKALIHRDAQDRKSRLVTYSRGFNWLRPEHFSWAGGGSVLWRRKLSLWAFHMGYCDLDDVARWLGGRWAFDWREAILGQPLTSARLGPFMPYHLTPGSSIVRKRQEVLSTGRRF